MSGQNTLITCANDNQIQRPKGILISRQLYRDKSPQGSGVYKAMDENGNIEIIGGPGASSNIPFGNDTDVAANNIQTTIVNATLTDDYTFEVRVLTTNTGATTMQINALGIKNVVNSDGNALVGGELKTTEIYLFAYNLTNDNYQLLGLAKPISPELWLPGSGLESVRQKNSANPNASNGDYSISTGKNCLSIKDNSSSGGLNSTAEELQSWAYGNNARAHGINSHAEGKDTFAGNTNSHAEGNGCEANAIDSHARGTESVAAHQSESVQSSGKFVFKGDAQRMVNVLRCQTSGAVSNELSINGTPFVKLTIDNQTFWKFTVDLIAVNQTGDILSRQFQGSIKRIGGVTTVIANTIPAAIYETQSAQDVGMGVSNAIIDAVASNANNALIITVSGDLLLNINWVASVELVQVKF